MSKQVKLKFKKLLKNAEFVYADLEYHEELLPDAKQGFFEAAQKVLDTLPDHIQKEINDKRNQKIIERKRQEMSVSKRMKKTIIMNPSTRAPAFYHRILWPRPRRPLILPNNPRRSWAKRVR